MEKVHPPPGLFSTGITSDRTKACPGGGVWDGAEMSADAAETLTEKRTGYPGFSDP